MAGQSFALKGKIMPFLKSFELGQKTRVLTHNFGYKYASKSIKGSIDADFNLVFNKTLCQKNGSMGWGPGPAKIYKTCLLCDVTFRNPPTKNEKIFSDFDYKTYRIRGWFG